MPWERSFDQPIVLPSGKVLTTLRDAGEYISALAKDEHEQPQWQTAMSLLMAVLDEGPTMLARIGFLQAVMPDVEPVFDAKRKNDWRKAMRR